MAKKYSAGRRAAIPRWVRCAPLKVERRYTKGEVRAGEASQMKDIRRAVLFRLEWFLERLLRRRRRSPAGQAEPKCRTVWRLTGYREGPAMRLDDGAADC